MTVAPSSHYAGALHCTPVGHVQPPLYGLGYYGHLASVFKQPKPIGKSKDSICNSCGTKTMQLGGCLSISLLNSRTYYLYYFMLSCCNVLYTLVVILCMYVCYLI